MGRHLELYQGQGDQTNVFGSLVTVMTFKPNFASTAEVTGFETRLRHLPSLCTAAPIRPLAPRGSFEMKLVGWPASKRRRRWKLEQGPEMVVQVHNYMLVLLCFFLGWCNWQPIAL